MKKSALLALLVALVTVSQAQEIQTIFKGTSPSGGYGAVSNKFTTINGEYANIVEVYGGWFIKKRFLLGIEGAAVTNDIPVPSEHSAFPFGKMSYEYGQFGLMTEYVFWSNRIVHFNINLFSGAGFTLQYERFTNDNYPDWNYNDSGTYDENFFYVFEPGAQVEFNIFRWLRLSPGVSYRKTFGADGMGITDRGLSDWSYNITLKAGKF